mgnify:CR=1 FL=1
MKFLCIYRPGTPESDAPPSREEINAMHGLIDVIEIPDDIAELLEQPDFDDDEDLEPVEFDDIDIDELA